MNGPIVSWLSERLLGMSARITPSARREWAMAMRAESSYLPPGSRLSWACGCLVAAVKLRFAPMETGSFRINRWVMLVEVLGCFGALCLAWWEFTFGPSGVVRLDAEIIDKYFVSVPGGTYILGLMVGFAISGLVGPIGVFLGMRYVFSGRALSNRLLAYALISVTVLQSLAGAIGKMWMGSGDYATGMNLFVMLTLLPLAAIIHLMYLARPAEAAPRGARLAAT